MLVPFVYPFSTNCQEPSLILLLRTRTGPHAIFEDSSWSHFLMVVDSHSVSYITTHEIPPIISDRSSICYLIYLCLLEHAIHTFSYPSLLELRAAIICPPQLSGVACYLPCHHFPPLILADMHSKSVGVICIVYSFAILFITWQNMKQKREKKK